MVAQNIFFSIMAATMIGSALKVVTTRNVVHAALWLILVLAGAAGQFLLLGAEFVGVTQVLVYIGAVIVLFLFGIMLTKAPIGQTMHMTGKGWPAALGVSLLIAGLLAYVLIDGFGDDKLREDGTIFRTADVSDSIFSTFLVPFEAISVLLLAALIGAIVLARKD